MDEIDVQQKARAFIASVDTSNIRTDLSAYVQAANAKLRTEKLGAGEAGFTVTKPNGQHVITVNTQESEERRRFTICHEIAHLILNLPSQHQEIPSWSFAKRDLNEVLCDNFAAELLMPNRMWAEKLPNEEPSVAVIEHMAAEFRTSFPAAASRFANLADIPCAFVTMERGLVRYAVRSTSLRRAGAWIPPKSPVPAESVAYRLRAAGKSSVETDEIAQDVWFENWDKGLDLWELSRHYARFDTTISLLWFTEEDLPMTEVNRFGVREVDNGALSELTGELPWPGKSKHR